MAAMILNSPRAVDESAYVVRAFVQLREVRAASRELAHRLDDLEEIKENIEASFKLQDATIADILSAIRQLINPPNPPRRRIGCESDS
jgi:hypothetical protein